MAFLVSAIEGFSKDLQNEDSTWAEQGTQGLQKWLPQKVGEKNLFLFALSVEGFWWKMVQRDAEGKTLQVEMFAAVVSLSSFVFNIFV